MRPEQITAILNEHKHDGETDWAFRQSQRCYFSAAQMRRTTDLYSPLSPASAEIIAQHYKACLNADDRDLVAIATTEAGTMSNAKLIAEGRMIARANPPFHGHNIELVTALADALEATDRERDVLAAGFKAAYQSMSLQLLAEVEEYPDDPDNVAIREALALVERSSKWISSR